MNCDCLERLGCTFEQARAAFGWRGLLDFFKHIPANSATVAAVEPKASTRGIEWQQTEVLASIFDGLAWMQYNFAKSLGGHPLKPQPYPLPWRKPKTTTYGRGAIPVADFDKWYYGGD